MRINKKTESKEYDKVFAHAMANMKLAQERATTTKALFSKAIKCIESIEPQPTTNEKIKICEAVSQALLICEPILVDRKCLNCGSHRIVKCEYKDDSDLLDIAYSCVAICGKSKWDPINFFSYIRQVFKKRLTRLKEREAREADMVEVTDPFYFGKQRVPMLELVQTAIVDCQGPYKLNQEFSRCIFEIASKVKINSGNRCYHCDCKFLRSVSNNALNAGYVHALYCCDCCGSYQKKDIFLDNIEKWLKNYEKNLVERYSKDDNSFQNGNS